MIATDPLGRSGVRHGPRLPRSAGPLLLYTLIALSLLWPYRSRAVRWSGDMKTVLALTIEGQRALAEGQFPIRVAPDLQGGARYPQFQYYGNFPFTVTGSICAVVGGDPYLAWKMVTLASLIGGAYGMLRLAYALTRNYSASTIAGAVFLCAPYLLTDLNARVAFTELIAVDLLPLAFYFSIRCFRSVRPRYAIATAVAWALVAFSHNITYLYGVLFAGLLFLSCLPLPRWRRRFGRLALAGALHAALVLWYVLPQLQTVDLLTIGGVFSPQFYAGLTPWRVLLAPTLTNTPEGSETPNLGLQVGWPILAFILLAVVTLWWPRRATRGRRGWVLRLVVLWAIAFFVAWTPFDFWRHVPRAFWFVQFPYRLLMFTVLFGAVLGAFALSQLFPRRLPGGFTIALLAILGLSIASYSPHGRVPLYREMVAQLVGNANLERIRGFEPSAEALTIVNEDAYRPADPAFPPRPRQGAARVIAMPRGDLHYGRITWCDFSAGVPILLAIPVLDYPGLLDVRVDGRPVAYGNSGKFVSIRLRPGAHHITLRFVGLGWANAVSGVAWGATALLVLGGLLRGAIAKPQAADRRGSDAVASLRRPAELALNSGSAGASPSRISLPTMLIGFLALVICAAVPNAPAVRHLFQHGPDVSATADHSTWDGLPEYAFDDLPQTAWRAGTGQPTHLAVRFARPTRLHGIILEPRLGSLYEGWRHVRVRLIDEGKTVWAGDFAFPSAGRERQQVITFPSMLATGIAFDFADPVDERKDGSRIRPALLSPGYSAIRLLWDE
jgi:hypothetical protein